MKDYKQVTDSVFKKAEQRIAEKKRRSAIARRNAIAASGIAAALFIVMLQNDNVRSAIKSLPKLASSGWFDKSEHNKYTTTSSSTTQSPARKQVSTTKTTSTESTTESTTTETTTTTVTTTETTTTTAAAATEPVHVTADAVPPPVEEKPSKVAGKPLLFLGDWSNVVSSATSDTIVLDTGMRINLEYGAIDYRNKFKTGDTIKYDANFVYDDSIDTYYYVDGYIDFEELRRGKFNIPENITTIDTKPYEEYYNCTECDDLFDGAPFIDYDIIRSYEHFKFFEVTSYKIEAKNIRIKTAYSDNHIVTEDGQEWYLSRCQNVPYDSPLNLKNGDVISFIGYFMYYNSNNTLSSFEYMIKLEN